MDNVNRNKKIDEALARARAQIAEKASAQSQDESSKIDEKKQQVHINRAERALASLPALSQATQEVLDIIKGKNLSRVDVETLVQRLTLEMKKDAVVASTTSDGARLSVGSKVRIATGKYVGQVGILHKKQRIRCFVLLPDGQQVYLYISDVTDASQERVDPVET